MNTESAVEFGDGNRASCVSDMATNIDIAATEIAVRKKRKEIAAIKLDPNFDGINCIECDRVIEAARLKLVKTDKCAGCAQEIESKNKLRMKQFCY